MRGVATQVRKIMGRLTLSALLSHIFKLSRDIYVIAFSFPVVPKGKARIRTQISASHSAEDIDHAVAAFTEVGKQLGVIN